MEQGRQVDKLDEEASAEYLQGRFGEALRLWRELQALDSGNERAMEGIRLCEMLADEAEPSTVFGTGHDAVPSPSDGDGAPLVETPPLVGQSAEPSAPMVSAASDPAEATDDPFAGLDDMLTPDSSEPESDHVLEQLGESLELGDLTPIEPDPETRGLGDAAAQELRSRVDELLIEATRAYETGDREAALSVLERVFILDEEHAVARSLQQQIEAEPDGDATEPVESIELTQNLLGEEKDESHGEVEAASSELFDLDAASVAIETETESTASTHELSTEVFDPSLIDVPLDDLDLADEETGEGELSAPPEPTPEPPAESVQLEDRPSGPAELAAETVVEQNANESERPGRAKRFVPNFGALPSFGDPRAKMIGIGFAVLLVAAGAWFGISAFGSADDDADLNDQVVQARLAGKKKPAEERKLQNEPPNIPPAPELPPPVEVGVEEVLAKAGAASDAEDWATAVVEFNRALEIDPGNRQAQRGFEQARDAYRTKNEYEGKLANAIGMFERSEYRSALRVFYRLPNADGDPKFDHYKVQGWYNLGVRALKVQDCADARSHFAEIEAIAPSDPDLVMMIALANACRLRERDDNYADTIESLEFRTLDP